MNRIIQILPTISYGDAVSNDALNLMVLFRKLGYETQILAENISPKVKKHAKRFDYNDNDINKDDIVIYHKSTGTKMSYYFASLKCKKKIMIYHNITPAEYFKYYNKELAELVQYGSQGLKDLVGNVDYCIADSEYNKLELDKLGFKNVVVIPLLISFDDYKKKPSKEVINNYKDDYTNLLFVGRIAPNKRQEEIIKIFYYYKKYINKKSRLFLVGSYNGMEKYLSKLKAFIKNYDIDDVTFTGHISFQEILGYYHIADAFLCMSEHEGFCVPLIESMLFNVPIFAYNSAAIPYTLANSGVLLKQYKYYYTAELIDIVINNEQIKERLINGQIKRLNYFSTEKVEKQYIKFFNELGMI